MSSLSELFNVLRKPLLPNQSLGLGSPKKHVKNLLQGTQVITHKAQGDRLLATPESQLPALPVILIILLSTLMIHEYRRLVRTWQHWPLILFPLSLELTLPYFLPCSYKFDIIKVKTRNGLGS